MSIFKKLKETFKKQKNTNREMKFISDYCANDIDVINEVLEDAKRMGSLKEAIRVYAKKD